MTETTGTAHQPLPPCVHCASLKHNLTFDNVVKYSNAHLMWLFRAIIISGHILCILVKYNTKFIVSYVLFCRIILGSGSSVIFNPNRTLSVEQQRQRLPIFRFRNHILYLLEKYQTLVVVGETGCGKSTQIPQYLCEAGWASQGVCFYLGYFLDLYPFNVSSCAILFL